MSPSHDDVATTIYLREPPRPVHPPRLAPEPARPPDCPTCPFRQDAPITLVLPTDMQPGPRPTRPLASRHAPTLPRATDRPAPTRPEPGASPAPRHAPTLPRATGRPAPTLAALPEPGASPARPAPHPMSATLTELRPVDAAPHASTGTTTDIRPAAGSAAPTVVQPLAAARRHPRPLPRSALKWVQIGLWVVIAGGLLVLAFRPSHPPAAAAR